MVLIAVGIVLAVCCIGGIGGGLWLYNTFTDVSGPAQAATKAYLDDIIAGNYPAAYGRLCQKVRTNTSQDDYVRVQSAQRKITSYEVVGTSVSNYNGRTTARVSTKLVQDTGLEIRQGFPLVKEDGEWHICD